MGSKEGFIDGLHRKAREKGFPLRVMFELTYACNFCCQHCYIPYGYGRGSRILSQRKVFSLLDQLKDLGCLYLGFTGGEPFMRKDLLDILCHAKRCGFQIMIYTNGSRITPDIAGELGGLQINKVDITVPAIDEKVFDQVVGVKGAGKKVFKGIELLHKANVPLAFKTCLLKANEHEVERVQRFSHQIGALHRLDAALMRKLDGSCVPFRLRGKGQNGCLEKARDTDEVDGEGCGRFIPAERNSGLQGRVLQDLFVCGAGLSQAAIDPFGRLKPCLMLPEPLLDAVSATDGLHQAWRQLRHVMSTTRVKGDHVCEQCQLAGICKPCPAKSWAANGDLISCDEEMKIWARSQL